MNICRSHGTYPYKIYGTLKCLTIACLGFTRVKEILETVIE